MIKEVIKLKEGLESTVLKGLSEVRNCDIVIWGTGYYGRFMFRFLRSHEFHIVAFCDSFFKEDSNEKDKPTQIDGIEIHSPGYIYHKYPNAVTLLYNDFTDQIVKDLSISTFGFSGYKLFLNFETRTAEKQLINFENAEHLKNQIGFTYEWVNLYTDRNKSGQLKKDTDKLINLLGDEESKEFVRKKMEFLSTGDLNINSSIPRHDHHYFSNEYFKKGFNDNEVLFDCGAFTGDTIKEFIRFRNNKFNKILGFEPDPENYLKLENSLRSLNSWKVFSVNAATGEEEGEVVFKTMSNQGSKIINSNQVIEHPDKRNVRVKLCKLDDFFDFKPTFIKMDIEGAELGALKGAEKILKTYKPKLAISIYHKPFDIFEIPFYLKEIVPEYNFVIRQHIRPFYEIVLYASVS